MILPVLLLLTTLLPGPGDGQTLRQTAEDYQHHAYLDSQENYLLRWKSDEETITFEVTVRTRGWVGLGLSTSGSMQGADMAMMSLDNTGEAFISDRYSSQNGYPSEDSHQDWRLLSAQFNATHSSYQFSRYLYPCDQNDMEISDETIRLIYAYSDSTSMGRQHSVRGTRSIQLRPAPAPQSITTENQADVYTYRFQVRNYPVPAVHTSYSCSLHTAPSFRTKHHIYAFESIIEPAMEGTIHHIFVYGCYGGLPRNTNLPGNPVRSIGDQWDCYDENTRMPDAQCMTTLFGWAVGTEEFSFPDHVGFPIGRPDHQPSYMWLEIHYDNPSLRYGLIDNSGLSIKVTSRLRNNDAGLLQIGSAVGPDFFVLPPRQENFTIQGHCPDSCLREALEGRPQGVQVFAHLLHTHGHGRRVNVHHISGNQEKKPIATDKYFDYNFQEIRLMKEEATIRAGDRLMVECDFSTRYNGSIITGGLATNSEMCYAFLMHYPALPMSHCVSYPSPRQMLSTVQGIGTISESPQGGYDTTGEGEATPEAEGTPQRQENSEQTGQAEGQAEPESNRGKRSTSSEHTTPMLGMSLDGFYRITSGQYTDRTIQQVLSAQNWGSRYQSENFERVTQQGSIWSMCMDRTKQYQSNNQVTQLPSGYNRYWEQKPQCKYDILPSEDAKRDPNCFDDQQYVNRCPGWKGYCTISYQFMSQNCRRTCGFCGVQTTTTTTTTAPPQQQDTNCFDDQQYANRCPTWRAYCVTSSTFMNQYCPRTCNSCNIQTTTTTTTTTPAPQQQGSCSDSIMYRNQCEGWKNYGYCTLYASVMRDYCSKTCGFCSGTESSSVCLDDPQYANQCRTYALQCQDQRYRDFMLQYCKGTCNVCT